MYDILKERMLISNERMLISNEHVFASCEIYSDSKLETVENPKEIPKTEHFHKKMVDPDFLTRSFFGFLTRKMGVIRAWFKKVAALLHFPFQSIKHFLPIFSHSENPFIKAALSDD